jgi:SNF2 family DNA or RNA helicase
MKLKTSIFQTYIMNFTSSKTREKRYDSIVKDFTISNTEVNGTVKGTSLYKVKIVFNEKKVRDTHCSCPFTIGPVCKHVVTLMEHIDEEFVYEENTAYGGLGSSEVFEGISKDNYSIPNFTFDQLDNTFILKHSMEPMDVGRFGYNALGVKSLDADSIVLKEEFQYYNSLPISIQFLEDRLSLSCACKQVKKRMCSHMSQALYNLMERKEIRIHFDQAFRTNLLFEKAKEYGLENESNLDELFEVENTEYDIKITPKIIGLIPVNLEVKKMFTQGLISERKSTFSSLETEQLDKKRIVVIGQHKYYDYLNVELIEASISKNGQIKNPLRTLKPLDHIWNIDDAEAIKFYTAIAKVGGMTNSEKNEVRLAALKRIVSNPIGIDFYYHNSKISDNFTSSSVLPIQFRVLEAELSITVQQKEDFYEITGKLLVGDKSLEVKNLKVKFNYFIQLENTLYLIANTQLLKSIQFFKKQNKKFLIHKSKYKEFQESILVNLESNIQIHYGYQKVAKKKEIALHAMDSAPEKMIYLSDAEDFVCITPVVKYGESEIPILSKRQIYIQDEAGNEFSFERNKVLEEEMTCLFLKQMPELEEQLHLDAFFIHKSRFLDNAWFLDCFETWREHQISILGFNSIKNNRFNTNKGKVSVQVSSGIDWFDTALKVEFGNQTASFKQLAKAVKNKSKYVELGDGTLGLLAEDWIEKFGSYFRAGEIHGENIRTHKVNFSLVSDLYAMEVLSNEVQEELIVLNEKLASFERIDEVSVPKDLKATLRDYQLKGLSWLNFLDDFGFGGCLADDMGLGKTIQIIAFILSQREKGVENNVNLIVVPTSLINNWQNEVAKFAPSIKLFTLYGPDRVRNIEGFGDSEIILTTYGTVLSDIDFLKKYRFNYVFLDESQAIKNPDSQRYKSVRLLEARNRIVLTGTPIENNTFDLYGQFSFACPGLLGNKTNFRDLYAIPIDKFKEVGRAKELQKRINPFLLRRTKKQVANELPDKTEMVIYCEMGPDQRQVYNAYKEEVKAYLNANSKEKKNKDSIHILAALTKLRQICNSPALLNEEEYYGSDSSKIDVLLKEINSKIGQHKILVFSQFTSMLDLIKKELDLRSIRHEYLTGKTKNRAEKVDAFQGNEDVRVFLISLKAGGTGLNLTEADYVYLVDPWWNPAVENQAIDRCYRIGQKKNVVAVRLICPDTIEDKIMTLQTSKKELASDLIQTEESVLKSLSREDLLSLV